MAQVTQYVRQRIDQLLDLLFDSWQLVEKVAEQGVLNDEVDVFDFIEEWPVEEDRLRRLEQYVAAGMLTTEQLRRYHELRRMIERNRPPLRRIQENGVPSS